MTTRRLASPCLLVLVLTACGSKTAADDPTQTNAESDPRDSSNETSSSAPSSETSEETSAANESAPTSSSVSDQDPTTTTATDLPNTVPTTPPATSTTTPNTADTGTTPAPTSSEETCPDGRCSDCPEGTTTSPWLPGECVVVCSGSDGSAIIENPAHVVRLATKGCEVLDDTLNLSNDVRDLEGLETLRVVTGDLVIQGTTELAGLTGLDNLQQLGGGIVLIENQKLESLAGLNQLAEIGGNLTVLNNPALTDISALKSATFGSSISITLADNDGLLSLDGLEGVTQAYTYVIADLNALQDVSALGTLSRVDQMTITANVAMSELNFTNLTSLSSLVLASCGPTRFTAERLLTIGTLTITTNANLETISLPVLETVQYLTIAQNDVLVDIGSFDALESGAGLTITANPQLPQCAVDSIAERIGCGTCSDNNVEAVCD